MNIVHRDLKLGNMILNKTNNDVTITNFCLGKHLLGDNDVLKDQRGSPAYISPEVLSGACPAILPSMWGGGSEQLHGYYTSTLQLDGELCRIY